MGNNVKKIQGKIIDTIQAFLEQISGISILGGIICLLVSLYIDKKIEYTYVLIIIFGALFLFKFFLDSKCSLILSCVAIVAIHVIRLHVSESQLLVDLLLLLLVVVTLNRVVFRIKGWLEKKRDEELERYMSETFYEIKVCEIKTKTEFNYMKHRLLEIVDKTEIDITELKFQAQYILDKNEEQADNLKTTLFPSLAVFVGGYINCVVMFMQEINSEVKIFLVLAVVLLITLIISEVQTRKNKKAWIAVSFWRNVLEAIKEIELKHTAVTKGGQND